MGWFDEQIKQRKKNDDDVFADAFIHIAGAVMGSKVLAALNDSRQMAKTAMDEILKYYHVKPGEVPDSITDSNEQLEYLLRPHGIMRRTVKLSAGWYRDATGAMLAVRKSDGGITALIPSGFSGYSFFDRESGKRVRVNKKNQTLFETEAVAFYRPLPLRELGTGDLLRYIAETLSVSDLLLFAGAALALALMGMLSPKLNHILFSDVIESGSTRLILAIGVFMVSVLVSTMMITAVKELIMARINTKMSIAVEAAAMARLLSLPAAFFKDYSAGELSSRAQYLNTLCNMLVSAVLSTGLTSVFSLVYLSQIFVYAPALVVPALGIVLVTLVFSVVSALVQMKVSRKQMELSSKESGMSYALISGVQ